MEKLIRKEYRVKNGQMVFLYQDQWHIKSAENYYVSKSLINDLVQFTAWAPDGSIIDIFPKSNQAVAACEKHLKESNHDYSKAS